MIEFTIPLWPIVIAAGIGGALTATVILALAIKDDARRIVKRENDRARHIRVLRRRHMDLDPVSKDESDELPRISEVKAYHGENVDWKGHKIREPRI